MIIESCVDSLENAVIAEDNGASQLELCSRLDLDGLTPGRELIKSVLASSNIPIKVMIRPREGDFCYSKSEFEKMISDIRFCREIGITEIVTGILNEKGNLNIPWLEVLASIANPMKITIHKCVDLLKDPIDELEKLGHITEIHYILSSGGASTALQGAKQLIEMDQKLGNRFKFIAAGKITKENLEQVHKVLGLRYYHGKRIV